MNDSLGAEARMEDEMEAHIREQARPLIQRRRPMSPNTVKPDAEVILDSSGAWLKTPKDDGFLESLKALVPYTDRQWVPEETSWFVTEHYAHNATELVKLFFKTVDVKDLRNV